MRNIILTTVGLLQQYGVEAIRPGLSCYNDHDNSPRHCQPPFENIAFQKNIEASDTCGSIPQKYCVQTGASGATQVCRECDQNSSDNHHNSSLLTDFNNVHKITWWQSQSMLAGDVQYPNSINLTLNLEKAFEITYVRLRFHSPRPESFAIYKKTCGDDSCPWIPYQYYSGSCDTTYPSPDG
jgi:laminin gamma 1